MPIEYSDKSIDPRELNVSTHRGFDNWGIRITHKPTGLFVERSGMGKFEHAVQDRRDAVTELEEKVYDQRTKNQTT